MVYRKISRNEGKEILIGKNVNRNILIYGAGVTLDYGEIIFLSIA